MLSAVLFVAVIMFLISWSFTVVSLALASLIYYYVSIKGKAGDWGDGFKSAYFQLALRSLRSLGGTSYIMCILTNCACICMLYLYFVHIDMGMPLVFLYLTYCFVLQQTKFIQRTGIPFLLYSAGLGVSYQKMYLAIRNLLTLRTA